MTFVAVLALPTVAALMAPLAAHVVAALMPPATAWVNGKFKLP